MRNNKLLIILVVIVGLSAALYFVTDYGDRQAAEGNPYGKEKLHEATIDQLDDPDYDNQILPEDLDQKLADQKDVTVYYYSPTCPYCKRTTPVLVDVAEDMGVDVKKFNSLEFNTNAIESTPTIVHYENGEEEARVVGQQSESDIRAFFNQNVLDDK